MSAQAANERLQRFRDFLTRVKHPAEPPGCQRAAASAPGKKHLRILAEGDSWFEYPFPWPRGDGIIYQLERLLGYEIANMAHHGLEMEKMLGLERRKEMISRLTDPQVNFDALLFSGGGNDIAGDQLCIWLKDKAPLGSPADMLDEKAVGGALALLEAEYRELIAIRDEHSPQTVIFVHSYDFPPVTGKAVLGKQAWLKPSLDYVYQHLGIVNPSPEDESAVVKALMEMFSGMLNRLATDPKVERFVVVPTQGTLQPCSADWQNELHPSSTGFVKMAQKFHAALMATFP
jgi:hypothetical protein